MGTVQLLPGDALTSTTVAEADVLLVRSITTVDKLLLAQSKVQFVGSATAGIDHVDTAYLKAQGIGFAAAAGANADSVAEWVVASLLHLAFARREGLRGKTLGVVGVGQVGGRVALRAEALGMQVLRCDPPRVAAEPSLSSDFFSLSSVLSTADVVTLHTPLTYKEESAHPTFHRISTQELKAMRKGSWVLNASRGAVVDGSALYETLKRGYLGAAALDVWEREPSPDAALIQLVDLATPHVAGYSFDAKVEGTRSLERAFRSWLASERSMGVPSWDAERVLRSTAPLVAVAPPMHSQYTPEAEVAWLHQLARQAYCILDDDTRFRTVMTATQLPACADAFRALRATYPRRRSWRRYRVEGDVPLLLERAVTEGLGMQLA